MGIKARLYRPFKPKEKSYRVVKYRDAIFLVLANEDVGWRLIVRKTYEAAELNCLEGLIREYDTCLDVGGNLGIFSVFMARKAVKGRVVVFEPIPMNRRLININAMINEVSNIELRDCVLSDEVGIVDFSVSIDSAYSSMIPTDRKRHTETLSVMATTLDETFAKEGTRVDIIKIDVEGAELPVLMGARVLLGDKALRPRALLVEVFAENAANYGYTPEELVNFMVSLDYNAFSINGERMQKWRPGKRSENVLFLASK